MGNGIRAYAQGTIANETVEAVDGRLYFQGREGRHPVTVIATTGKIRVGCVMLTREAWEVLKRKVDGVKA